MPDFLRVMWFLQAFLLNGSREKEVLPKKTARGYCDNECLIEISCDNKYSISHGKSWFNFGKVQRINRFKTVSRSEAMGNFKLLAIFIKS